MRPWAGLHTDKSGLEGSHRLVEASWAEESPQHQEPRNTPGCSVVIVNWNAGDALGPCLRSLGAQAYAGPLEVLVWDNASTDDSLDVISKCGDAVHVIESTENVGFAKGNNSAARRASGELLVFLNPDTYLPEPDTLSRFVGPLGRPQIGLVGPMLHNADGSLQKSVSGFPSLSRAIVVAFGLHRLLSDRAQARFAPVSWSQTWSREVDWVKGAALACRAAEFWEIGGFPEDTFMYGEDAELAYRFHDHGLAVFYTVDTAIFHLGDHSSKKCWTNEETAERTARAAVLFLRQRHSRFQATAIRTFWTIGYALRAILWHRSNPEGARVYAAMCRATAARPAMQKT